MIAGSLFSGIEGLGLGLLWSGLITSIAFQVEIDPFCRRVLEARFPYVDRSVQDVRAASASNLPAVDMLFGGWPCQDVSAAGKGAGLGGERSGLVREMLRLVDEFGPGVVLLENVASGKRRWVCPVRGRLEALGYRTAALNIGVDDCGGPHRRRRIFILAYADGQRQPQREGRERRERGRVIDGGQALAHSERGGRDELAGTRGERAGSAEPADRDHDVANASGEGRSRPLGHVPGAPDRRVAECARGEEPSSFKSRVGARPHGLPPRVVRWPAGPGAPQEAWEPPRVAPGVEGRAAKLRAIGNAVSPVQAYHVGLWAREALRRAHGRAA